MMRNFNALKRVVTNMKFMMVGLLIVAISGTIYSQKVWTLKDCIEYALDNNIQIKKSELNAEMNKANFLQSKLDMLPSLNGYAQHGFNWGRTADLTTYEIITEQVQQSYFQISSQVDLFNGFQKYNTIKKAQSDYLASKYDSDKMRDDISLMLAQNYLNVLFSMELVEQAQAQLDVTQLQIRNTQKLVEAGTLPKGSLLEIQSQFASEEVTLINAENRMNLAYLDLLQLLELPATDDFKIEKPILSVGNEMNLLPTEQIYGISVNHLPQIKSAELRFKSAESGLAIARGARSPRLSLSGNINTRYSDRTFGDNPLIPFKTQFKDNSQKGLTLQLNIPIFNGFATSTNITRAKITEKTAEYDLQLSKNTLRKAIEQAYSDALAAYKTYNASIKSVASFQESFKYMEQKFNVGLENSLNYNVAKMQLTSAQSQLLSNKYDYIFKSKILDFYMGNPLTLDQN
mgnify:CR=1 FL=1